MTSGLLTLLLIATVSGTEPNADVDALIAGLVSDGGQVELQFRERRDSALLEEPIEVRGTLWRNERGDLVRQTTEPRRETQTLTGSMIIIERPGRSPRNYSMGHAPELEAVYRALTALLAGDAEALREHFALALTGEDGEGWRLVLTPRAEALSAAVEQLSLRGHGETLDGFELALRDGETIRTELSGQP